MSEKRQVAARGRHTDDRITAKFYSQNRILKSRADWDHSDASITWVRSPGEPGMNGRPPWGKMRPLGVSICLQQGSEPQGVAPELRFPKGSPSGPDTHLANNPGQVPASLSLYLVQKIWSQDYLFQP